MGGGAVIKMIELCPDNIFVSSIFAADDLRSQTNWLHSAATTAPECKLHSHLFDKTNTADNDDNNVGDDDDNDVNNVGDDDDDVDGDRGAPPPSLIR